MQTKDLMGHNTFLPVFQLPSLLLCFILSLLGSWSLGFCPSVFFPIETATSQLQCTRQEGKGRPARSNDSQCCVHLIVLNLSLVHLIVLNLWAVGRQWQQLAEVYLQKQTTFFCLQCLGTSYPELQHDSTAQHRCWHGTCPTSGEHWVLPFLGFFTAWRQLRTRTGALVKSENLMTVIACSEGVRSLSRCATPSTCPFIFPKVVRNLKGKRTKQKETESWKRRAAAANKGGQMGKSPHRNTLWITTTGALALWVYLDLRRQT